MNFLPAEVISWQPDRLEVRLTPEKTLTLALSTRELATGDAITLGIRPEHLLSKETENQLEFNCEVVERLGNSTYLFGQCYGTDGFKMLLPGDMAFNPYQSLTTWFDAERCMVFDDAGLRISAASLSHLH